MPRYFFDVHDGEFCLDLEGTELPDRRAMRDEAIRLAGEILKDLAGKLIGEEWNLTVRDESRRLVMAIRFTATEH